MQVVPLSRHGRAARRQPIGYAELISRTHWPANLAGGAHCSPTHVTARQADSAQHEDTAAEQMHIGSTDLLPRLPLGDAVVLAALVGTGRMNWPEINAALAARIKLAAASEIRSRTEPNWRRGESSDACTEWQEAKRAGEGKIRARYNAECDALFAECRNPSDAGWYSIKLLFERERKLDRLRSVRDRALADLATSLGPRPIAPALTSPAQTALIRMRLSAAESEALGKLEATGFAGSAEMDEAIKELAVAIAESLG